MRLGLGKIIFGKGVIIAGAKAIGVIVFLRDGGWRKVQWFLDGVGLVGGLIGGFCLKLKLRLAGIVAIGAAAVLLFFTHIYYRLIKFIDLGPPFRWCLSPDCHAVFFSNFSQTIDIIKPYLARQPDHQMYKLYTFAKSSTAWRARIALNLKRIQAENIYVNLFKGEQRTKQYKQINPNTGVPTLVLPNGTKLIESVAIIQYLNEVHPQPNDLFPGDPANRALIRGFCEIINSGIHPYQNLRLLEKIEKDYGAKRAEWTVYWITQGLTAAESLIAQHNKGSNFVFGNQITAADVFLYPQVYNSIARYNLDISGWPNIQRIFGKLSQIKEIQDAAPEKQKDFE